MTATAGLPAAAGPGLTGTLAPLPDGLNVAIGHHVSADTGAAPGTTLAAAVDGDGTSRWCPSTVGPHTLTVDLGHVTELTGAGVTFSGEEGNDGSSYSVSTGVSRPDQTPMPHQATGHRNPIVQGPLYLFAGSATDVNATVKARYVTLHYQVPREQSICVQEFRVFSDTTTASSLQLGGDLTGLVADDARTWTSGGVTAQALSILTAGGLNYGRIRLLVNPTDCGTTCANLTNGLAVAKRLKAAGVKIALDLEYADSLTSSTAQPTPVAWSGQSLPALARTVHDYTRSVIAAFAANGTPVAEVSLGNDISQGILWPAGQLRFGPTGHADWSGLTTLLAAGARGVRDGAPRDRVPLIQVALDSGADNTASVDFLNHLSRAHVPFDIIAEAYLPWQNGSFTALAANLHDLTARYHKPLVVTESQFPYANIPGFGSYSTAVPYPDTLPGYAISPAGQASYQRDLVSLLASLPHREGLGVFYSTPDTAGSLGWFTSAGTAQPAADAFRVGSAATLYQGRSVTLTPSAARTVQAAGSTAQPATNAAPPAAAVAASGAGQPDTPPQPGALPPLPAGLDIAIGAKTSTMDGAAPGTPVGNVADGDGTSAWCPGTLGTHTVTIDLGRPVDITGTGVTFSGEQSGDGATYRVSTGLSRPDQAPMPHQAAGGDNPVGPGAQYLFAGSPANVAATVKARYVTLTYQEPRERNVCVQELRVFSANAHPAANLQLGADLSTLISDTATYTLNGISEPILSIFKTGGLNYVRLRLWINPGRPDCSAASCPSLANDLAMAKQIKAAGMGLLLDFHYSDTWADPQHQNVPSAWAGQTLSQLTTSIRDYTQSVIAAFAENGTPVDQAAIGNEITQGTIWAATSIAGGTSTVVPAGTTTIKVASTSGIRPGDTLFIDAGANLVPNQLTETDRVVSVGTAGPDGTGIILAEPLEFNHAGTVAVQDVQASGKLLFDPQTGKADWTSLTTLLGAAVQGAKAGNPAGHQMLIQLHVDRGADNATTVDWFNHMVAAGVPFDVIGESYYPWYHGPMSAMKANLTALVNRFHKYVMIAEDQFPQNPQGGYGTYNAANANYPDTLPGYLVTPAGQASYQRDLNSIVASLPDSKGLGVFYWDGDGQGNLGMFDRQHAAQPVIYANQVGTATDTVLTAGGDGGGASTTFTATVAAANPDPAGDATGAVQFAVDSKPVSAPVALSADGTAQWTAPSSVLRPGRHTVTARYLGGWYFWPSQSDPLTWRSPKR